MEQTIYRVGAERTDGTVKYWRMFESLGAAEGHMEQVVKYTSTKRAWIESATVTPDWSVA